MELFGDLLRFLNLSSLPLARSKRSPRADAKQSPMRFFPSAITVFFLLSTCLAWGDTLFELVDQNRVGKVQEALAERPELVNRMSQKVSLLHVASFKGSMPMVKMLLENGADLEAGDMLGASPLHRAFANEHNDLGLFLLEKGAELEHADKSGVTPFMLAARSADLPTLKKLLAMNPDLEREDKRGRTALHHSMEMDRWENVSALIEAGSDLNSQDEKGSSLLHKAVAGGKIRLVDLLRKAGIDENLKDKRGRTAFQLARQRGDHGMVNRLKPQESAEVE